MAIILSSPRRAESVQPVATTNWANSPNRVISDAYSLNEHSPSQSTEGRDFRRAHPEFMEQVRWAKISLLDQRNFLKELTGKAKRGYVRQLLNSPKAKLYCMWCAVEKKRRFDLTPDEIVALADAMNVFKPCDENITTKSVWHWRRKERQVNVFGLQNRARQELVRWVMEACFPLRENQYFYKGVPAAHKAVEEAVASGMRYGVELDVVSFYPSITSLNGLVEVLYQDE
jgi:hypothetical protein